MEVFLSWSGSKSHAVAEVLQKYLPALINGVNPWLSSSDISAGARWSSEIAAHLEASNIGIICLTPDNLAAPWILFEAGAIAKHGADGRAMVLRIDLSTENVEGPLGQFQSVSTDRQGILKLATDINDASASPVAAKTLEIRFDGIWTTIERELTAIIREPAAAKIPRRAVQEMVEELLDLSRAQISAQEKVMMIMDASQAELRLRLRSRQ